MGNLNWENITKFGSNTFRNCAALELEELNTPSLTTMGVQCFNGVSNLKRISNLGLITNVPGQAFQSTGVTFAELPETVTNIEYQVFRYANNLETVLVRPTTPPTIANSIFQNTNDSFLIYVPATSVSAYREATN